MILIVLVVSESDGRVNYLHGDILAERDRVRLVHGVGVGGGGGGSEGDPGSGNRGGAAGLYK